MVGRVTTGSQKRPAYQAAIIKEKFAIVQTEVSIEKKEDSKTNKGRGVGEIGYAEKVQETENHGVTSVGLMSNIYFLRLVCDIFPTPTNLVTKSLPKL
ncbi:hypothetical protein CHS0354_010284 [Potamilus streckersoni]|uniref:Uncharacterized protein n=1 Tax=Potamilus streckersoni TaxID=2493646 RepID=A0AAE0TCQ4_9BIVA|nr:hypothetical protein CHS0354_010284 [Potamilus streckersoni]